MNQFTIQFVIIASSEEVADIDKPIINQKLLFQCHLLH